LVAIDSPVLAVTAVTELGLVHHLSSCVISLIVTTPIALLAAMLVHAVFAISVFHNRRVEG